MHTLFIDIETIPSQKQGALEECRANIKAPGNMSKPETISAWMRENAESSAEDAWRKTALDGSRGGLSASGGQLTGQILIVSTAMRTSQRLLFSITFSGRWKKLESTTSQLS